MNKKIKVIKTIEDIEPSVWNQLANGHPFLRHQFFLALEKSKSIAGASGWIPLYLCLYEEDTLIGFSPLFLKHHSYGEYIFDWNWAEVYRRSKIEYYPKLITMTPFTPVVAPKFVIKEGYPKRESKKILLDATLDLGREWGVSSIHHYFIEEDEVELESLDFILRDSLQFHWENNQYNSLDEFLSTMKSKKAKQIKKERREVKSYGLTIKKYSTEDLQTQASSLGEEFYSFYQKTIDKKQAYPYLTKDFFKLWFQYDPEHILLMSAKSAQKMVGMALHAKGNSILYGRYWGGGEDYKYLHFEMCYYLAIEYAIANKFTKIEAGAQGPQKLIRGYRPTIIKSLHHIYNSQFHTGIENFIKDERIHVEREYQHALMALPFKEGP